ncbi:MAG: argininosuccinate lyase [Deltaproteobacteria bacterium]|nr:MAG: argininosuccinate lyase [Deltaproteobacteria bacterium]
MVQKKLWGGRFREKTDDLLDRFNSSIRFDKRLYAQDIQGSIAHCRMLAKERILSDREASRIIDALEKMKREIESGELSIDEGSEDIHTFVERALVEKVGETGEKLHTGRSRNDQVSLDMRLYVREAGERIKSLIKEMQRALIRTAEKNFGVIIPGYTHLQRAQPVLLAHHLLAYYEMLKRDRQRFSDNLKRASILPLGSAALAGSSFKLDRKMAAKELGFAGISENSMDAVSDRDFVLEFLFASSVLMMHLSRLSEEVILWSTREFNFVTLPDAFCTGSSIMPQKKNPDLLELVRGKTGRVYGHLMALLTVMKGLPLAYNKDMQEDKEALFDTVDTVEECIAMLTRLLKEIVFNAHQMKKAVNEGHLVATDLADYLVRKGATFRNAHELVGKMVLFAADRNIELSERSIEQMKGFSNLIEDDVKKWLDPVQSVKRRSLYGGTGHSAVKRRLKKAIRELES